MIWVGDISGVVDQDWFAGCVEVSSRVHLGVEGADKMTLAIIQGSAEPALTCIMNFRAKPIAAGPAPDGCKDIYQEKRKKKKTKHG